MGSISKGLESAEVVKGQGEELFWKPGSASSATCGETSFVCVVLVIDCINEMA